MRIGALIGASFLCLLAATADAGVYELALTQTGVGDDGPDWFGTVEGEIGETVTRVSLIVAGVDYGTQPPEIGVRLSDGGEPVILGTLLSAPRSPTPEPTLEFSYGPSGGVSARDWYIGTCATFGCGFAKVGSYTLTEVVP